MIQSLNKLTLLLLVGCGIAVCFAGELPEAQVTVRVIDEETSKPISSAETRVTFNVPDGQGGTKPLSRRGFTDADGRFTAAEKALFNLSLHAAKDEYYPTGRSFDFKPTLAGRYEPVNPILSLALRSVVKPAPMYARRNLRLTIPSVDGPIGFDLVVSDWVKPYGNGETSDFIFRLKRVSDPTGGSCATLTITFSDPNDGIQPVFADPRQGSALRLPRVAPESGYQAQWQATHCVSKQEEPRMDQNYFYRVRTVRDAGKIKSAFYGKIHGEIEFDTINAKTAMILFSYYLNPDGSTNLEFDPKKNLLTALSALERVIDP
ncbi:MAG: hypothetical protein QOI07_2008 [Verrucomicrobiota bacterium]|jgi:hypothetical protein